MKIGIDVLGGDFAPQANLEGACLALNALPENAKIVLIGDQEQILSGLSALNTDVSHFEIVHAPDRVTMNDHPTKVLVQKPNSSIAVGFQLLAKKEIDVFASTGNTGAMMVGAMFTIKTIPGVIRPCITSILPGINGTQSIILDVGTNADCKPDVLMQFAELGALYSKYVYDVDNPKIGLLNIGEEPSKGNLLTQSTYKLLENSGNVNFTGNIEGRDLFSGKVDVVVCDGFTGNVVLKEAEAIYTLLRKRGIQDEYFDRFNYENYGGTPILGVQGNVIIGHGISNGKAVKNMILHSYDVAKSGLATKIKEAFNEYE